MKPIHLIFIVLTVLNTFLTMLFTIQRNLIAIGLVTIGIVLITLFLKSEK
jgi:hypothetical protein